MVFETIRAFFVQQLACEETRISMSTVILEDLEMEPSDLEDLMMMLEQEFGVEWSEEDLQDIGTVAELVTFVENQI